MKYYIYLGYDWKIENFIMPTISFFNFLNASAQCTNLDIVASKTDACAPEVIMYYVTNAPDGSLFEWEIAGNKFFGGDTIYQSHIDPASFMPKATISMLDGTYQGEMCQQGVYVYKIKAKSLVGKIFNEKGTDTLLR